MNAGDMQYGNPVDADSLGGSATYIGTDILPLTGGEFGTLFIGAMLLLMSAYVMRKAANKCSSQRIGDER